MRKTDALDALTGSLKKHFPSDVADALTKDIDRDGALVASIVRDDIDQTTLDGRISVVAADTDDSTKDWLAEAADSPAGWLYTQMDRWW